jgi:hypothetical protein
LIIAAPFDVADDRLTPFTDVDVLDPDILVAAVAQAATPRINSGVHPQPK